MTASNHSIIYRASTYDVKQLERIVADSEQQSIERLSNVLALHYTVQHPALLITYGMILSVTIFDTISTLSEPRR